MPLLNFNDPLVWDSLYAVYVDNELCHYERKAKDRIVGADADNLIEALQNIGIQNNHNILFVGSGFGWLAEKFVEFGYTNVLNVDTSSYIQTNKNEHAVLPILDTDILTLEGRSEILSHFNGTVDLIITEDVLPCLSDLECVNFCNMLNQISQNVIHWVSVKNQGAESNPNLNWKTLDEWKETTNQYVIRRGSKEVI